MRKKLVCLLLALALCLSLAGCGGVSYGVNPVMTLVSQDYSMAFRNDDTLYYYVVAALEEMNAEGTITELARKWLGSNMVSFGRKANALSAYEPPEPRTFIIGVEWSWPQGCAKSWAGRCRCTWSKRRTSILSSIPATSTAPGAGLRCRKRTLRTSAIPCTALMCTTTS